MKIYVPQPRRKRNESMDNFYRRLALHRVRGRFSNLMSQSEYKDELENLNIEYTEIELEKDNGRKIKLVIPTCQLQVMTKADINKLLKVRWIS